VVGKLSNLEVLRLPDVLEADLTTGVVRGLGYVRSTSGRRRRRGRRLGRRRIIPGLDAIAFPFQTPEKNAKSFDSVFHRFRHAKFAYNLASQEIGETVCKAYF
jgi:hypothetical protein